MFVLTIDTSTPAVVAGVVTVDDTGPRVVAERAPVSARGHTELLTPAIAECLDEAGLAPADVGAVVAGVGPGPYTGLRVGLVTAAAFADALGVPTYPVMSLDAIAVQAMDEGDLVVVSDARRGEVYWARYDESGERVDGPRVARPGDVPLEGVRDLAGAAAEQYAEVWPPERNRMPYSYPAPWALAALAHDRMTAGASGEPLVPLYLRRPDAAEPGRPKTVTR